MRFLVGADGKLRKVTRQRALRHVEANVTAAGATFLGADQRQVDGIGDKIGREQKTLLLALGAEVIRLAIEAAGEIALGVEDKIDVAIKVEHLRAKGGRNIARRLLAGAVEMLVPAIERNGEH